MEQPDEDMVSGLEEGHNRLQELVDKLSEVVVIAGLSRPPLPVKEGLEEMEAEEGDLSKDKN